MEINDFKTLVIEKLHDEKYRDILKQVDTDYISTIYFACRTIYEMLVSAELVYIGDQAKINYKYEDLRIIGKNALKISCDLNIDLDLVLDFLNEALEYSIDRDERNALFLGTMNYNTPIQTGFFGDKLKSYKLVWNDIKNVIKSKN